MIMAQILKLINNGKMEIKNQTDTNAELYFYGDITGSTEESWQQEDKCPQDIVNFLSQLNNVSNIDMHVNSGGGDMWAGVAIYNILKNSNKNITTYVDGIAASAASIIAMAGNKIIMPSSAQLMIHNPLTLTMGNAIQLRAIADKLDQFKQSLVNIYMEHVQDNTSEDSIIEMMDSETWMTGKQASETFNNIEVDEMLVAASIASEYFNKYKHTPKNLMGETKKEHIETKVEDKHEDKIILDELAQLDIFLALNC